MMLNRPYYLTSLCPPVMCRDANARVTADIVRSAECSRADASSWLKVRSTLNSLYQSHSLDCVTYRVAFTRHSLPLSLSPYVHLSLFLFIYFSFSLSPPLSTHCLFLPHLPLSIFLYFHPYHTGARFNNRSS